MEQTMTEPNETNVETEPNDILNTPLPMDTEEPIEVETDESAEEEQAEEAIPETEETDEDSTEEVVEEKPKRKKISGFKKSLNKKNARIQELEARLQQMQEKPPQTQEKTQDNSDKAPSPDDYEHGINDINYINENAAFNGRKVAREEFHRLETARQQHKQQTKAQQQIQTVEEKYTTTMDLAAEKFDDFEDVISSVSNPNLDPNVAFAIKDSDIGGEIFYHLASNPKELKRFQEMPPVRAVKEIGKLETKLTTGPKKKPLTKMPKPVSTIGTGKVKSQKEYGNDTTIDEFLSSTSIHDLD